MEQSDGRMPPYALQADEGWIYRLGVDFVIKAGEVAKGNGVAVLEYVTRKGEEPEKHAHPTEDEMFYVLEGSLTFHCGDESFPLEKGGFIFLPRGIPHGYTIQSEELVRLLVITAPTRLEAGRGWGGFVGDIETGQGELVKTPPHIR